MINHLGINNCSGRKIKPGIERDLPPNGRLHNTKISKQKGLMMRPPGFTKTGRIFTTLMDSSVQILERFKKMTRFDPFRRKHYRRNNVRTPALIMIVWDAMTHLK